jgi:hypothetical protein
MRMVAAAFMAAFFVGGAPLAMMRLGSRWWMSKKYAAR